MRRFNPEKELRRIEHKNRNKIIIGICSLLLIIAIGSTYALYQVRHTNKLVFNTVGEFKKRDIYLSVLVNGETQNEFPGKEDGYAFSGYECDGDANVTFDPDKWIASVNSNGPDKCTIKFGPKNINYDTIRKNEDVIVDETNDANLRYIGPNPENFIWFNCLKYDDLTNENAEDEEHKCERWRIIGLMNNVTTVNEESGEETINQSLIKIVRNKTTSQMYWNTEAKNDWANASLNKYLNSEENLNSPNSSLIANVVWYLGALNGSTAQSIYINERINIGNCETFNRCPGETREKFWIGKIALVYGSDHIFATNGGSIGRNSCLSRSPIIWTSEYSQCGLNSWLTYSNTTGNDYENKGRGNRSWTITPMPLSPLQVNCISGGGELWSSYCNESIHYYLPTVYLTPNIKLQTGTGTFEEPYIIK